MKRLITTVFVTISLLLSINKSFAWGKRGHALVAEVAFSKLDEATKKNVMIYLGLMTIEDAANWMDAIKGDHTLDFMKPWHYLDMEKGSKEAPAGDNVATVLLRTLKDLDHIETLSNDEIKKHILFLFHLIGDIHQPLHVGYPSDKGGNSVKISFMGARNSNLHSVWDSEIIEYNGTSLSDVLNCKKYTPEQLVTVKKIDVIAWAKQSRSFLKNCYDIHDDKINELYVGANYPIIESQLLDAGIRLASVLEHYFKNNEYK